MKKPIKCPLCNDKEFKNFPVGWDGHAEFKCEAIPKNIKRDDRKSYYKKKLSQYFNKRK